MANGVMAEAGTRRGVLALVLAVLVTLASLSSGGSVLLFPLWLGMGWGIAWVWERVAERKPEPKPSAFTRHHGSNGARTTIRQDRNAHFVLDHHGFLFRQRRWFEATGCPPVRIRDDQFEQLTCDHVKVPVLVATAGERRYWWWDDDFYWENEGYEAIDVQALVNRTRRQKERSLQHAHALLEGEKTRRRDPIPEDVRRVVWQRDGGRCQECGSDQTLQYDHVIPWSQGGADTAANL